jgi:hypothetical protein
VSLKVRWHNIELFRVGGAKIRLFPKNPKRKTIQTPENPKRKIRKTPENPKQEFYSWLFILHSAAREKKKPGTLDVRQHRV